jgi:hypothetical protein
MRVDDWMVIVAWQSRALLLEAEELPAEVPLETVFRCKLKVTNVDDLGVDSSARASRISPLQVTNTTSDPLSVHLEVVRDRMPALLAVGSASRVGIEAARPRMT